MDDSPETAADDVRKVAIAKLKRAASLPRMKDGRRPAMHKDGVSEGEKSGVSTPLPLKPEMLLAEPAAESPTQDTQPTPETPNIQSERVVSPAISVSAEETPKSGSSKRRSRSRSRSRGSKDFRKSKNQTNSTPQNQSFRSEESSQDEDYNTYERPVPPPLTPSPILYLAQQQAAQVLHPNPFLPNFVPMAPPTLEALQRRMMQGSGLHRSNSAREQAMNKLLGIPDQSTSNQALSSGPPSAFPANKLQRSNTTTGFERSDRSVARSALFRKLSNRRPNNGGATTEGEQTTSGGEEVASTSRKPIRRSPGTTVVDDRDPPNISSNTPSPAVQSPPNHLSPLIVNRRLPSPSPSHTSSKATSARRQSLERNRDSALAKLTGENQFEFEPSRPLPSSQPRLVVEENDDPDPSESQRPAPHLRHDGMHRLHTQPTRRLSPKQEVSTQSPQLNLEGNPVLALSDAVAALGPQVYADSPVLSPVSDYRQSVVDDRVVYGDDSRNRRAVTENIVSWVELEEPPIPINDNDSDIDNVTQPGVSTFPESVLIPGVTMDSNPHSASPDNDALYEPRVPSDFPSASVESNTTGFSQSTVGTLTTGNEADESSSESVHPCNREINGLPSASRVELSDWENIPAVYKDAKVDTVREEVTGTGSNKFDTIKKLAGKLSRTPSFAGSIGRRSRSNSVVHRKDADAGLNRESASSFASGRHDNRSERLSHHAQLSASESMLSLGSPLPPSGAVSHMPVASSNDTKYLDSKLYPFPGMLNLQKESERKRARGMSVSTPDVTVFTSSERSPGISPSPLERSRKLSTQASDSRLQMKYKQDSVSLSSITPKTAPTVNGQDYFLTPRKRNGSQTPPAKHSKLPMDKQGVKHWLKKFGLTQSKSGEQSSKSSFSDVKSSGQRQDEWDESAYTPYLESNSLPTPESYGTDGREGSTALHALSALVAEGYETVSDSKSSQRSPDQSPIVSSSHPSVQVEASADISLSSDLSPISTALTSLKPEPTNGLFRVAELSHASAQPNSRADSPGNIEFSRSSKESLPRSVQVSPAQHLSRSTNLIRRFNYILSLELWDHFVDEPPRKLVASSPVLQVVGADTVKRRIILLYSDLIILAKPLNSESMGKDSRPSALLDDPITVKTIFRLKDVRLRTRRHDRKDPFTLREAPNMQVFVRDFRNDPDRAVTSLMKGRNEPETLACILFNAHDLDREQLSSYLARRSSKQLLRSFVDNFGFSGVRVDEALRVFWLSVGATASQVSADALLQGFATRWFDANSQLVSFDRDLAMRIVGAIMQLNQALHSDRYDAFPHGRSRLLSARDFVSAFRRYDPRHLVADDLLEKIYYAVELEKLAQPLSNTSTINIRLKQSIPNRLIYRVESESIVVQIPEPDSNFSIQLLGHGLLFNPPVLQFASSSDASFRVTGTSLGSKTIIMSRIGPNAPFYSGLPISRTLTVEKAFMQNVFQLTTTPLGGVEKTYMFSVDENHHHLQQQLETQVKRAHESLLEELDPNKLVIASETIALKALSDTLLSRDSDMLLPSPETHSPNDYYLHPGASRSTTRQWTARSLTRACRQNSLLPSLLRQASQTQN